jgi:hypothetical protein
LINFISIDLVKINKSTLKRKMVLDINLFRAEKGGTPDLIRASEKKRGNDGSNVDKVIELDEVWRKCKPNHPTQEIFC